MDNAFLRSVHSLKLDMPRLLGTESTPNLSLIYFICRFAAYHFGISYTSLTSLHSTKCNEVFYMCMFWDHSNGRVLIQMVGGASTH